MKYGKATLSLLLRVQSPPNWRIFFLVTSVPACMCNRQRELKTYDSQKVYSGMMFNCWVIDFAHKARETPNYSCNEFKALD